MSESRKGSGMRYARSVVIWASLAVTIVALVVYVVMVFAHQGNPVWNRALLAYCGVFWVFFAFDEVGRRTAILGEQKRASAPVPRPRPQPNSSMPLPGADGSLPGQRFSVSAGGRLGEVPPEVGLQRIQREMLEDAQAMVDDCLTEVLALSGTMPRTGPSGHVPGFDVEAWLGDDHVFPFLIMAGGATAGLAALEQNESSYELKLLYVRQGLRRQRIGQRAFTKLEEFSRLLGIRQTITAHVSSLNMRGQRFYRSVGMALSQEQGWDVEARDMASELAPEHKVEFEKDILRDS